MKQLRHIQKRESPEINETRLGCKYCQSKNVIKYGKYKEIQYYYCKNCGHKYSNLRAIPKMQYPTSMVAEALDKYYQGVSLNGIRRSFIEKYNNYVSEVTAWNWINRFTQLAITQSMHHKPKVSNEWVLYETKVQTGGNAIWIWDILDTKTLFLIASQISQTHSFEDFQQFLKQTYELLGTTPTTIYTESLNDYLNKVISTLDWGRDDVPPFEVKCDVSVIKRFYWAIEDREKVLRCLHSIKSATLLMNGWYVYYNFFMPRTSLRGKTPASLADVKCPFSNWKGVCEQAFAVTARIPIN